jgi:glyoxylase-like metal-dependent hydrolase (beta-lactamase superfamily II)
MAWEGIDGIGGLRVARGIWRWVAFHPEWKQDVACAAIDSGAGFVLVDPLLPAGPQGETALRGLEARDETPAIVLTVFYHERSAGDVMSRIPGATLWVEESGVDRVESTVTHPFRAGDALPGGLVSYATARPDEVVLWDPASRSLIVGDVILGHGAEGIELCPDSWLPDGVSGRDLALSLGPLLELPVERILPGHGDALDKDVHGALERVLEAKR